MPATTTTTNRAQDSAEQAFELRRQGMSYGAIAATLGYAHAAVARNAVVRVLLRRPDVNPAEVGMTARPAPRRYRRAGATDIGMTFGVEIECMGVHYSTGRNLIAAVVEVEMDGDSYTHARSPRWKVVTDATLGYHSGAEFVTPPLARDAMAEQVTAVTRVLRAHRCTVPRNTGLHVHVGTHQMTGTQIANIVGAWVVWQRAIDMLIVPTRRADRGEYSGASVDRSYSYGPTMTWLRDTVGDRVLTDADRRAMPWNPNDRYRTLNVAAMKRHGTIEFRQHSGSLNGSKIMLWVDFLHAFVRFAMDGTARVLADDLEDGLYDSQRLVRLLDAMTTANLLTDRQRTRLVALARTRGAAI